MYYLYCYIHHGLYQHSLKSHTSIRISPEPCTAGPSSRVPLDEVGNGDAVQARDSIAALARLHEVELFAVGNHASLDGLRCRVGGAANDAGADVVVSPHTRTRGTADLCVPGRKLGDSDTCRGRNGHACVSGLNLVEFVAVCDHARLDGRGRCNSVAGTGWGAADHAGADVIVSPDTRARRAADLRVP